MKLTSTFRRQLKTSRRFVFENIMDLDHVCVVHKRWFSRLRKLVRTPERVEYRLRSHFYGLHQDLLVRGERVDANQYWYEFLGPLAQIRVEGHMDGPDGDLTLTETIVYYFHWAFTPFFWLLRPLFQKQKQDILQADASLLERVYALDQAGFQRAPVETRRPRVIVYGGNGFFGRLLVRDLLLHSRAEITVGARHVGDDDFHPYESRVRFVISDIRDFASVRKTIEGADIVISCVGPYQGQTLNVLRACIEQKIHYVDVADDRDFVVRCHGLSSEIEQAGIMAFVGCSVVPVMSSLLVSFCREIVPRIEVIRTFITPGTRSPRGPGSFLCLLSTVGSEFSIPVRGESVNVRGWTGREKVSFPPPLGNRWVYFVVDIANYFLHPIQFAAKTVEFKIGAELDALNRALDCLRWVREHLGVGGVDHLVPMFRVFIYGASLFGSSAGAVMVEVTGRDGDTEKQLSMSVFGEEHGEIIPAILPSLATQMILNRELNHVGIVSRPDWIDRTRFTNELGKRQIKLAIKHAPSQNWVTCECIS